MTVHGLRSDEQDLDDCRGDLRTIAARWDATAQALPDSSVVASTLRGCAAELRAYEKSWDIEECEK